MEHDIKALANQGDSAAIKVMRIVTMCKVSVVVNILMVVVTFIYSNEINQFIKFLLN